MTDGVWNLAEVVDGHVEKHLRPPGNRLPAHRASVSGPGGTAGHGALDEPGAHAEPAGGVDWLQKSRKAAAIRAATVDRCDRPSMNARTDRGSHPARTATARSS